MANAMGIVGGMLDYSALLEQYSKKGTNKRRISDEQATKKGPRNDEGKFDIKST